MILDETYVFYSAYNGEGGLRRIRELEPDVVLLDINLGDTDGLILLKEIVRLPAAPIVIMITGIDDTDNAVTAIKSGAADYFEKHSSKGYVDLVMKIRKAADLAIMKKEVTLPAAGLSEIIGESQAIKQLKQLIGVYAVSDGIVLIRGESGTGKELVAQALHKLSYRREQPFVAVNCSAIPANLVETSLFGSEKGAYTDAVSAPGYFEKAHQGTLFLDEIGEMSPEGQAKLLRVLENFTFERVGGSKRIVANVRIVAATNRKLKTAIAEGKFREDLYYRLKTFYIDVPPLRERSEDIPLLAAWFASKAVGKRLAPDAFQKLAAHSWPGNIRELKSTLERSCLLCSEPIMTSANILLDEE